MILNMLDVTGRPKKLEDIQRDAIKVVLADNHGNITKTAKELGISRSKVYRKLGLIE